METAALFVLSVLAVASAAVVVTHRNPVISALALAMNLVAIAGFYLALGAQFVALLQILVYAGAILVLILFVIMLLNLSDETRLLAPGSIQRWLAPLVTLAFVVVLGRGLLAEGPTRFPSPAEHPAFGTVGEMGRELFARFYYPFEILSLLLVVAMVGAVLLAKRRL